MYRWVDQRFKKKKRNIQALENKRKIKKMRRYILVILASHCGLKDKN